MADLPLKDRIRREMRRSGVVLGFLLVFLLLVLAFRGVIVPFLVAMFLAYLVEPVVVRMSTWRIGRFRLGRGFSLIALYLVMAGLLALGTIILLPRVSQQVAGLAENAPRVFQTVRSEWIPELDDMIRHVTAPEETEDESADESTTGPDEAEEPAAPPTAPGMPPVAPPPPRFSLEGTWGGQPFRAELVPPPEAIGRPVLGLDGTYDGKPLRVSVTAGGLPGETGPIVPPTLVSALDNLVEEAQTHFFDAVGLITAVLKGVVGFVYSLVLILMITAFIVVDREKISDFFAGLPPARYEGHYRRAIRIVDAGLSGVVRGQIVVCLINGVLTWVGLVLLGVPYSLLLGGVAAVFSLIPIFGTILSSVPIVAIALTRGFGYGLGALGWISVIHLIEANVINPRVIGSTAKLHPVIIVFALLAGEHAFGVVGALLAVPAASILISTFRYARLMTAEEDAEEPAPASPG